MEKAKLDQLDRLYRRYGFQALDLRSTESLVFWQNLAGRHIADIVPFGSSAARSDVLRQDLERSGYACRMRNTSDPAEIDQQLFSEFFSLRASRQRICELYLRFCQKLEVSTGTPYKYKPLRYITDSGPARSADDLVQQVCSVVAAKEPRLVIIEAAAAFGKTCTAYEIARELVNSQESILPMLAELARNRGATEFRYILLDEVNRNFPGVSSELARYQIQQGRLILLLDGFDELLYRPGLDKPTFEDAEPMLETIRDLLRGETCILITSRKSTLLTGDAFQNWIDSHTNDFRAHRFLLDRPDPKLWISGQRRELSSRSGLPLQQLANPVLFSFLESLTEQEFRLCCAQPERIVNEYVNRLLSREIERQDLRLSVGEQRAIFREVAALMAAENFKAERRSFLEEFIRKRFEPLLVKATAEYSGGPSVGVNDIVQKLLLHAFFDRRLESRDLLGFQNDFILGTLVGEIIAESSDEEWVGSEEFVDLAVTAYSIRSSEERLQLWQHLQFMAAFLSPNLLLELDVALMRRLCRPLGELTFSDMDIEDISIGDGKNIDACCFVTCKFRRVNFFVGNMSSVTFINCYFEGCAITGRVGLDQLHGFDCTSRPSSFVESLFSSEPKNRQEGDVSLAVTADEYERVVLENFWPRGKAQFSRTRSLRTLYMGRGHEEHNHIAEAIRRLKRRGVILFDGERADLNLGKIEEIIDLLGRSTC